MLIEGAVVNEGARFVSCVHRLREANTALTHLEETCVNKAEHCYVKRRSFHWRVGVTISLLLLSLGSASVIDMDWYFLRTASSSPL